MPSSRFNSILLFGLLAACGRAEAPAPEGTRLLAAATAPDTAITGPTATTPTAVVYKDANCGCCAKWVDHLKANGFAVVTHDVTDLDAVKRRHGIARSLHSCHTAEIDGYIVEGHVPADLIQKMLRERPDIAGLAVPGMPVGSPGMEYTYSEPYDVIAFTRSGATSVYARR